MYALVGIVFALPASHAGAWRLNAVMPQLLTARGALGSAGLPFGFL